MRSGTCHTLFVVVVSPHRNEGKINISLNEATRANQQCLYHRRTTWLPPQPPPLLCLSECLECSVCVFVLFINTLERNLNSCDFYSVESGENETAARNRRSENKQRAGATVPRQLIPQWPARVLAANETSSAQWCNHLQDARLLSRFSVIRNTDRITQQRKKKKWCLTRDYYSCCCFWCFRHPWLTVRPISSSPNKFRGARAEKDVPTVSLNCRNASGTYSSSIVFLTFC